MNVEIFNKDHEKVGTIAMPAKIFGVKWNPDLVHQVITAYTANRRQPVAHTKDRSEVRGGGKKPWKQKHTGRSRHGSSRSPIWIGGGTTHGPRNERNFEKKVNQKMKQLALFSVLSRKLTDGEIIVVDSLNFDDKKTKSVSAMFKKFFTRKPSTLLVTGKDNNTAFISARNIQKTNIIRVSELNASEALAYKVVLFEKSAIESLS